MVQNQSEFSGKVRWIDAIGLSFPPVGHISVDFRWQCRVVKRGTQMTDAIVDIDVFYLEMRFPPKVFVVKRVVLV